MTPYQAAIQIGVNRSTLARYLDRYPHLLDEGGRVDVDELRKHRADNVDVPISGATNSGKARDRAPTARARHSESRARLAEIEVDQRELEIRLRAGELMEAKEVAEKVIEATRIMRDTLLNPDVTLGERLASTSDPHVVRQILREWSRNCVERWIEELEKNAGANDIQVIAAALDPAGSEGA